MNYILQNLNNDLNLYLNEMYIIDELKEVSELQKLKIINIEKIEEIRKYLRETALIIQNNRPDEIGELIETFSNIYDLLISEKIKKEEDNNYYNIYFDKLKYIYYKEIIKITDINYRRKILDKLLQEKNVIKNQMIYFKYY